MKKVLIFFITILVIYGCNERKSTGNTPKDSSLEYDLIEVSKSLISNRQNQGDSVVVMDRSMGDTTTNAVKIVRINTRGYYRYVFCNTTPGSENYVILDSIPTVNFLSDSIFDVNGDTYRDLVLNGQHMNGQCAPRYARIFCFDNTRKQPLYIPVLYRVPNPIFEVKEKTILGSLECQMKRSEYKFKWNNFEIDTVFIKTTDILDN